MFAIQVNFLEGRVIAARPDAPAQLEWPLEPARLFMAFVAAHFEGLADPSQLKTLEWLETIQPSQIIAPSVSPRNVVTVFVPVNDRADDPSARSKQPRTFPSAFVGDRPLIYLFDAEIPPEFVEPLNDLLEQVVRVGHSSSLVRCSLLQENAFPAEFDYGMAGFECWSLTDGKVAVGLGRRERFRIPSSGSLKRLVHDYNGEAIEQYGAMSQAIALAPNKKEATAAKKHRDSVFPQPPTSRRPIVGILASYEKTELDSRSPYQSTTQTVFESTLIPLSKLEGNALGLESTQQLVYALRSAILSKFQMDAPEWVCGHDAEGNVSSQPHLAIVPLPFVGNYSRCDTGTVSDDRQRGRREYADGHLLGLGIVLPKNLSDRDKASALGSLLFHDDGEPRPIELTLGNLGVWTLQRELRQAPPQALVPETWSRSSRFWASVTPIVLDRHPKTDYGKDLRGWMQEASDIISNSCQRLGLPSPIAIRILKHGPVAGVPSSRPDRSGFPLLLTDNRKQRRQQTHAVLEFASPVAGPLLVGAGRFRGYGFCKPIEVLS